ncbi:MAG: short-chain fatty acid transporter [Flavobacteriales bacterium]|nr:short-chain fatty acid transporter [Flavobacteriales bacterium]
MNRRFLETYVRLVRSILPSPLSIAFLLTALTILLVFVFIGGNSNDSAGTIFQWWAEGLWNPELMVFALQMMLMLVLGHVLAISPWVARMIDVAVQPCTNSARSAAIVAFFTMLVGLFNWGLGLIFGAIMARKVGEKAHREGRPINYPLIGAAGYTALMIWHGGFSGSSLIKIAEEGHLAALMGNDFGGVLPTAISLGDTVFSGMNIATSIGLLVFIPGILYFIGSRTEGSIPSLAPHSFPEASTDEWIGAERLDRASFFSKGIGAAILLYTLYQMFWAVGFLNFFNPNNINLLLLGLCLATHSNIKAFSDAVEEAIKGASGILIQFPLYFGILAIMQESGMIDLVSDFFIRHSTAITYPIFTFISAGLVNIFVPSGGGQWAIQGPIIVQSAMELGIPLNKSILALAYGDEITNMLQPFWALPLLGITRLKAKDILPYTLVIFLVGSAVFMTALLLF